MPAPLSPVHLLKSFIIGLWRVVEFTGALIYYLLTEIFVDPFIVIKPIKIAAKWLYDNCNHLPVISLYFAYLVNPQGQHPAFAWASQRPWVVAVPPGLVVALTVVIKFLALSLALHAPVLAAIIFVGDKIAFVPIALRMWDEVRPVVRRDFILRQVDNVVYFMFHSLPIYARDLVKARMAEIKEFLAPYLAPVRERVRALTQPVREALRPLIMKVKETLKAWANAARAVLRSFFSRP